MSTTLWGVLVVSVAVVIAVGLLLLVNRLIPTELREEHNDVAAVYAYVTRLLAQAISTMNKFRRFAPCYSSIRRYADERSN